MFSRYFFYAVLCVSLVIKPSDQEPVVTQEALEDIVAGRIENILKSDTKVTLANVAKELELRRRIKSLVSFIPSIYGQNRSFAEHLAEFKRLKAQADRVTADCCDLQCDLFALQDEDLGYTLDRMQKYIERYRLKERIAETHREVFFCCRNLNGLRSTLMEAERRNNRKSYQQ